MESKEIRFATHKLGPPPDWNTERDGVCGILSIRKRDNIYESAWYPSKDELKLLLKGEPVILTVWGGQPPVSINVNSGEQLGELYEQNSKG